MRRSLVASMTALALCVGVSSVNAASYSFSFSNVDGPVAGLVKGVLVLPDGNGTFAASSVIITDAPAALGYALAFDVLANFNVPAANSFTVSGGAIDAGLSSFAAQTSPYVGGTFTLNHQAGVLGSVLDIQGAGSPLNGVMDVNNSTLAYAAVDVPLPAAGALMLLGLGGLGAFGRKRRAA